MPQTTTPESTERTQPREKRVPFVELFYDLVFVYMLSRATKLIGHLHHGVISPTAFATFAIVIVVFVNSWMVQTVFTNRYGTASWKDMGFYLFDMMVLLYMSNSFDRTDLWHLGVFFLSSALLSLSLMVQYLIVFLQAREEIDRRISRAFVLILLLRATTLMIGGIFSGTLWGTLVAFTGIIVCWILPALTARYTRHRPIIFSNLLERLTLLTIITFGEIIVDISGYFEPARFSAVSVLVFLIVATLYFCYFNQFDNFIDRNATGETGNLLIYLHYPILFGVSLVTVALKVLGETGGNPTVTVIRLYAGILLFFIGLLLGTRYDFEVVRNRRTAGLACFVISFAVAFAVCVVIPSPLVVAAVTEAFLLANTAMVVRTFHLLRRSGGGQGLGKHSAPSPPRRG